MKKIEDYFFFIFLFLLPIVSFPHLSDIYDFPKIILFYLFCSIFCILLGFSIFSKKSLLLPLKNSMMIVLFLFLLEQCLSTLFSVSIISSIFGIWQSYTGSLINSFSLVLIFLAAFIFQAKKKLNSYFLAYPIVSGFIVSLFGLYQYLKESINGNFDYRISSTLGEPNRLGFFLASILPLNFVLILNENRTAKKLVLTVVFIVILASFVLTQSRGAWLSLVTSTLLVIIIFRKSATLKLIITNNRRYLVILVVLILSLFSWQQKQLIARSTAVFRDLKIGTGSINIRFEEWRVGWKIISFRQGLIRFFLGSGPNTGNIFYSQYKNSNLNIPADQRFLRVYDVRNQYLNIWINSGFLGIAFYLIIIFGVFSLILNIKKKDSLFVAVSWSWLTIVIISIYYYQFIVINVYFWFLTGLIVAWRIKPQEIVLNYRQKYWSLVLIIVGLISSGGILFVFLAELFSSQGNYQKALILNPLNDNYWRLSADKKTNQFFQTKDFSLFQRAAKESEKALILNPLNTKNVQQSEKIYYLAGVVFDKKYQTLSLDLANRWLTLDPTNPTAWDSLGLVYLDRGDLNNALRSFQKAIELNPENHLSYLHSAEALKQMGQIRKSILFYQKAVQLSPDSDFSKEELKKATILDK